MGTSFRHYLYSSINPSTSLTSTNSHLQLQSCQATDTTKAATPLKARAMVRTTSSLSKDTVATSNTPSSLSMASSPSTDNSLSTISSPNMASRSKATAVLPSTANKVLRLKAASTTDKHKAARATPTSKSSGHPRPAASR